MVVDNVSFFFSGCIRVFIKFCTLVILVSVILYIVVVINDFLRQ